MTLLRLFSVLLALTLPAQAGLVTRITEFEPHVKVTADELNNEFDNIISTINGNIDSSNIAAGGIATANLATGSITNVKLAPSNYATSSGVTVASMTSTSVGSPSSTSPALSATLTITGTRAVKITLQSFSDLSSCVPGVNGRGFVTVTNVASGTGDAVWGVLYRNAVRVQDAAAGGYTLASNTAEKNFYAPLSGFSFIDTPSSGGSTTYEIKFYSTDSNAPIHVNCAKLIAVEL